MITDNELEIVKLSPTKKDFYQIWNELMDLSEKLSLRWNPKETNESDPGIVLLKVLTASADKLNYNIDKNTLEAFMPSAAQAESMRKLCDLMGYSMKYYQGATCNVTISYKNSNAKSISEFANGIYFPRFVNLKDEDSEVNYVTLESFTLQENATSRTVPAIEGELVECETDNDNIISMLHLDDNNRYFLPETSIAENGIFVFNVKDNTESAEWAPTKNLNTEVLGSKVFKVGYSSKDKLPYIQFPDDISNLIEDGLRIKYIRTNGVTGNISANTLTKLEVPELWSSADEDLYKNISELTADNFSVTNVSASVNGSNPESIDEAYNNYKKTIGTFDTLVTCRDYMNKIYQMTISETDTTPLVSNVIVSDIRSDLNKAITLCSFNEYGICYVDKSLKDISDHDLINRFDLVMYPFTTVRGINTQTEYKNSFRHDPSNIGQILKQLEDNKTLAHNIVTTVDGGVANDDLFCIKIYSKLNAKIITTRKVSYVEETVILESIKTAIYKKFNSRNLDLGQEIPYNVILETILNANSLIKDVVLDEPTLYLALCKVKSEADSDEIKFDNLAKLTDGDKALFNKLALRNVLAGRISAFEYNEEFNHEYTETTPTYQVYSSNDERLITDLDALIGTITPTPSTEIYYGRPTKDYGEVSETTYVEEIHSEVRILPTTQATENEITLMENEIVQFKAPNLETIYTYPAYVNYYLKLSKPGDSSYEQNVPAKFMSVRGFLIKYRDEIRSIISEMSASALSNASYLKYINTPDNVATDLEDFGVIFFKKTVDSSIVWASAISVDEFVSANSYYYFNLDQDNYIKFISEILSSSEIDEENYYPDFYRSNGASTNNVPGYCVDENRVKYSVVGTITASDTPKTILTKYYVSNNLGKTTESFGLSANCDYELKADEYILFNYTKTSSDDSGNDTEFVINEYFGPGTIIKPNFFLQDSATYQATHSFSKKSGYYFEELSEQPAGLFSLGTNEQICLRDYVTVKLNNSDCYLYWILNNDKTTGLNYFTFDSNNEYTLGDNEYLFYTDSKKSDLAFYGKGTTIKKGSNTPQLVKNASNGETTAEEVSTYGLAASIPWIQYNLSGQNAEITIIENQFITLTEGDTIRTIDSASYIESKPAKPSRNILINNQWKTVKGACYKFANDDGYSFLPRLSLTDESVTWKVRSILNLNVGPNSEQRLHNKEDVVIDYVSLTNKDTSTNPATLSYKRLYPKYVASSSEIDQNDKRPYATLTFYTNYNVQSSESDVDTECAGYDLNGTKQEDLNNFRLKMTESSPITLIDGNNLNLNNYGNNHTKFAFENINARYNWTNIDPQDTTPTLENTPAFTLKVSMDHSASSTDLYGLLMVYYIDDSTTAGKTAAKLKVKGTGAKIKKFNTTAAGSTTYSLQKGLNVLEVSNKATSIEVYSDSEKSSVIVFSKLAIVQGINKKLCYFAVDKIDTDDDGIGDTLVSNLEQLLSDIQNTKVADNFYYNVPIENSKAIELNSYVIDDNLLNPRSYYDTNNINNNFVITEIDSDYLSQGITLTKSSKNY